MSIIFHTRSKDRWIYFFTLLTFYRRIIVFDFVARIWIIILFWWFSWFFLIFVVFEILLLQSDAKYSSIRCTSSNQRSRSKSPVESFPSLLEPRSRGHLICRLNWSRIPYSLLSCGNHEHICIRTYMYTYILYCSSSAVSNTLAFELISQHDISIGIIFVWFLYVPRIWTRLQCWKHLGQADRINEFSDANNDKKIITNDIARSAWIKKKQIMTRTRI